MHKHSPISLLSYLIPKISKTKESRIIDFLGQRWVLYRKSYKSQQALKLDLSDLYAEHLKRIRKEAQRRKIKICFYVNERQKWQTENLFQEFTASDKYEVSFVFKHFEEGIKEDNWNFFKAKNVPIYLASETDPKEFDLIFYQQPGLVDNKWKIINSSQTSLTCYVPYCVYCLKSENNDILGFHNLLWKQFADSKLDQFSNSHRNSVFLGSTKIESMLLRINCKSRRRKKLRVVYAPHHSFSPESHRMGTWKIFGNEILKIAEDNQELEWIFRPHPRFCHEVLANKLVSPQQLASYYSSWERVGLVDLSSPWEDLLSECDLLITDCISFLFDFWVTGKPLIHLRSLYQKEDFTDNLKKIINEYMQVYDVNQLNEAFLLFKSTRPDMSVGPLRKISDIQEVSMSNMASKNIFNYIDQEIYG